MFTIKVTAPKNDNREMSFNYDTGETLDEAINLFGEIVIKDALDQQVRIDVGQKIRPLLSNPAVSDAEVITAFESYEFGVALKKDKGVATKQYVAAQIADGKTKEEIMLELFGE